MQFIDLRKQYALIAEEINAGVFSVLESQQCIMGPEIQELEERLAEFVGVKHVLSCSSGTDALVIALKAYDLTVGDAVFVPSFTFFASAESITLAGGTPIFVDTDEVSFNMDPESLKRTIRKTLEEDKLKPRGIMSVDLFGQPADYSELQDIADQYGLFLIEDACQSFGATYRGKRAGSSGNVGATSFFPAKPLGCYGDGGAIFTDDDDLADAMRSIRVHGQGIDKYDNQRIGINGRLDTIQAAVLLAKLDIFEDELVSRNRVASQYTEALKGLIETPLVADDRQSSWAQYTLKARDSEARERIIEHLREREIPSAIYYPVPIHLSRAYASLNYKHGDLPICESQSQRVFSIPMHPYLSEEEIAMVVDAIKAGLE